MTEEEELMKLKLEVAKLKLKKHMLEEEKALKIERLKAKLGNLYPQFASHHPVLATIGSGLASGAKAVGNNVASNANRFTNKPVVNLPEISPYKANKIVSIKRIKKVIPKKEREERRLEKVGRSLCLGDLYE